MTAVMSPDAEAVRDHLASARFQQGVDAGIWRVIDEAWPTVTIAVAAAPRDGGPGEYALRIDLTRYPLEAPTFEPWNVVEQRRLAADERPKGDRSGHIFRTNWEDGRALYTPYDRIALAGHPRWADAYPRSVWRTTRDLTFALEHIWEALNDAEYLAA
jgi:hypothetical protein